MTGNDITSVAIDGTNVTFNGKFLGHLDGVISDIAVGEFGGNSHTWRGNSYNLYGIRASGSITANSNFDGAITLKVNAPDNPMQDSVVDSNVYGMYATTFMFWIISTAPTVTIIFAVYGLIQLRRRLLTVPLR